MRSRLLINLVLLVIVICLALFLSRTTNHDTAPVTYISDIDPDSIRNIKIIRRDLDDIIFNKINEKWMMQAPYKIAANIVRINSILRLLKYPSYVQLDKNEVELDRFLLDNPAVSVLLDNTKIDFGDTSPLNKNEQRYVLLDNTIHLTNDNLYQQLLTNASFFISPRLLPDGAKITAIQFPDHRVHMVNDIWQIDPSLDISADDIISLINAWQDAQAVTVRKYIETGQNEQIIVELEQAPPITFIVTSPLPNLVLARPEFNVQYHLSSYETARLFPGNYYNPAGQAGTGN